MWKRAEAARSEIRLDIRCRDCGHIEFLHSDVNERQCLYTDCRCQGYVDAGSAEDQQAV